MSQTAFYQLKPIPTDQKPKGSLSHQVRCIMFDIYGTLFISGAGDIGHMQANAGAFDSINGLLKKYEFKLSADQINANFLNAIAKEHERLKSQGIEYPEVQIDQIWQSVLESSQADMVKGFAMDYELATNPVYPMPHLEEVLQTLKKNNVVMGIISNAQFYTPYLFKWFLGDFPEELGFSADLIFYSFKYRHAKPSMFLFEQARQTLGRLHIPAHQVLYVGNDMLKDILPAKKAGFNTALFAGDQRSLRLRQDDKECLDLVPDLIITDLLELLDHL